MTMQPPPQKASRAPSSHSQRLKVILIAVGFIIVAIWGIVTRINAATTLAQSTHEQAIPTVAVLKVPLGPIEEEIVLPGNVQAWHEAPIYARTNGYLKSWTFDIGAHVKAGDLLAEIETPEVDAQFHQAQADLATAEANNQLSQRTLKRWQALLKTNSVSKQDADEKEGDAASKEALAASARANLDRLRNLEDFKHVLAPFEGTITARNTDNGALINAGSGNAGQELFHIAETDKLRVYVQLPENYSKDLAQDIKAELHFSEYPQRSFLATLSHTADALDPITRTLLVEFAVNNEKGELLPGSYAEVHLKIPSGNNSIHIPVNTLMFRAEGLQIATVDENNKAQLKTIVIGRDYGKEVEVTSGLEPNERVIINPPDSLINGQDVHAVSSDDLLLNTNQDPKNDKKDSKSP